MKGRIQVLLVAGLVLGSFVETSVAQEPGSVGRGQAVYQYWCATCHGAGPGMPGTTALRAKYDGRAPAPLADRTDLTPESVRFFVRNGVSIMPFFRKTEVGEADLDALVEYLTRVRPEGEEPPPDR